MIDLGDFLGERLAWPRRTGTWDCCAFPAEWCISNGLPDPMADYRGEYATDDEADHIVARSGGLAGIFGAGLEGVGLRRVEQAELGDVGVIDMLGQEAGAIYTGRRWAFIAERGLGFVSLDARDVPHIWRLPDGG
jgi:hypothetical protein